ncbi:MAG: hypothetical protein RLZZ175_1506 [Bacteroidota bacterium]|jgi:hypothetical protein
MNIIKPNYLSLTTQQLAIGFTETDLIFSTATGFIYLFLNEYYLITNWHNVTGRNPLTGKPLTETNAGIPNIFLTYLRLENGGGQSKLEKILLYEDDEMTLPKWLVHPQYQENVDVVAIKLNISDNFIYSAINTVKFDTSFPPEIGDDCFVIGYPFDDFRYLGLPIWKKASIATEPTINEDQLPKIFIDTATRPGLSGSPVIYQRHGVHYDEKVGFNNDSIIGTIRGFLGVYSGRIGKEEIHAQLGIVWKKEVIDEIIIGNTKGNIEFQYGKTKNDRQ